MWFISKGKGFECLWINCYLIYFPLLLKKVINIQPSRKYQTSHSLINLTTKSLGKIFALDLHSFLYCFNFNVYAEKLLNQINEWSNFFTIIERTPLHYNIWYTNSTSFLLILSLNNNNNKVWPEIQTTVNFWFKKKPVHKSVLYNFFETWFSSFRQVLRRI